MKTLLISLLVLTTSLAHAGELDKLSVSQAQALPQAQLEKMYLKDNCPDAACDFGYSSDNGANLSKAERMVIWHYTQGLFQSINPALIKAKLNGAQTAFVRIMDSALKKIPSEKRTVYRGTAKYEPAVVGGVINLKAYTSTSVEQFVAEGFVRDRLMIIKTKTAKDIQDYSNSGMERELVLPRGVKLKVEKVVNKKLLVGEDPSDMQEVMVEVVTASEI